VAGQGYRSGKSALFNRSVFSNAATSFWQWPHHRPALAFFVWAGIGGVVYGSSITTLTEAGVAQFMIRASAVRDAASFYRGRIMGGVLRAETDALFRNRRV
jgi:hypothetical protein